MNKTKRFLVLTFFLMITAIGCEPNSRTHSTKQVKPLNSVWKIDSGYTPIIEFGMTKVNFEVSGTYAIDIALVTGEKCSCKVTTTSADEESLPVDCTFTDCSHVNGYSFGYNQKAGKLCWYEPAVYYMLVDEGVPADEIVAKSVVCYK